MGQYLFGLMILETCDCGARCRRLFNYDWDDATDIEVLDTCPRCSKLEWPRIDDIRFYKP